ncbi:hypothetical protein [Kitasatospora sp. NPDC058190]|uniref:hypothetical protein n=1 Tax=Kitasatospora sp. NPDC058190 TaxID=3346371 RepID=UPI0036DC6CDA
MGLALLALPGGLAPVVGGTVVRVLQRLGQGVPSGAAEPPPHRPERAALGEELLAAGDQRSRPGLDVDQELSVGLVLVLLLNRGNATDRAGGDDGGEPGVDHTGTRLGASPWNRPRATANSRRSGPRREASKNSKSP